MITCLQARGLQSDLKSVQEELCGAKCQVADLEAAKGNDAAQHGEQLAKIAQERQQLEMNLESKRAQHDAAIAKAKKVMQSMLCAKQH